MTDDDERARRLTYLHATLNLNTSDQRVDIRWVKPYGWSRPSMISLAGDHYHLGFSPPWVLDGTLIAFVCDSAFLAATDHLDSEGFFAFVAAVLTHMYLHISEVVGSLLTDDIGIPEMWSSLPPDLIELGVMTAQRTDYPDIHRTYTAVRDHDKSAS